MEMKGLSRCQSDNRFNSLTSKTRREKRERRGMISKTTQAKMMVIELCGNPGSGKSTIAKELIKHLASKGFTIMDARKPYDSYHGFLRTFIKYRIALLYRIDKEARKVYRMMCRFSSENSMEQNDKWARRFQRLAYIYSWAQGKTDFLIVDEGPIQYLTSFFYLSEITSIPEKLKTDILSRFYDFDQCLLSISVPVEENVIRIMRRGKNNDRFNSDSVEETTRLLALKNRNVQNVIRILGLEHVHTIDNSSDIERAVNEAASAIDDVFNTK